MLIGGKKMLIGGKKMLTAIVERFENEDAETVDAFSSLFQLEVKIRVFVLQIGN